MIHFYTVVLECWLLALHTVHNIVREGQFDLEGAYFQEAIASLCEDKAWNATNKLINLCNKKEGKIFLCFSFCNIICTSYKAF
jgi:hypothetical protein